ncbi:unnamed protein product [Staurois parvus]|uniref:Uncharacterized protein n=1 Tax=Staurois parvus TaxID=386267 RepID=A0ABN9DC68_9NEOB|nr:unnamed protein product [Staurois parvus]
MLQSLGGFGKQAAELSVWGEGSVKCRGRLITHGAPGNRGSWGPCVLAQIKKIL